MAAGGDTAGGEPASRSARTRLGRIVAVLNAVTAAVVLVGAVALWPSSADDGSPAPSVVASQRAEVVGVSSEGCVAHAGPGCRRVDFVLLSGARTGERSYLTFSEDPFAPELEPGDRIQVVRNAPDDGSSDAGAAVEDPNLQPFAFVDFERGPQLAYLGLAFAALVVLVGRWQGVRSLLSLGLSLAIIVGFIVPAILAGRPPLLVAVVGGMAVMLITMSVTHGPGLKSGAAILATTAALVLTALLAAAAVEVAQITGLASEESRLLSAGATSSLSLRGLVIAGIIIGALGVLDDVTISQASTVLALKRVNPSLDFRQLFVAGLQVGRDHLGATINTLVLAYVGAALPVLLIFGSEATSLSDALNRESVAEEIVATLVGSIGLLTAVPLTTALAALLAARLPAEALGDVDAQVHAH